MRRRPPSMATVTASSALNGTRGSGMIRVGTVVYGVVALPLAKIRLSCEVVMVVEGGSTRTGIRSSSGLQTVLRRQG